MILPQDFRVLAGAEYSKIWFPSRNYGLEIGEGSARGGRAVMIVSCPTGSPVKAGAFGALSNDVASARCGWGYAAAPSDQLGQRWRVAHISTAATTTSSVVLFVERMGAAETSTS